MASVLDPKQPTTSSPPFTLHDNSALIAESSTEIEESVIAEASYWKSKTLPLDWRESIIPEETSEGPFEDLPDKNVATVWKGTPNKDETGEKQIFSTGYEDGDRETQTVETRDSIFGFDGEVGAFQHAAGKVPESEISFITTDETEPIKSPKFSPNKEGFASEKKKVVFADLGTALDSVHSTASSGRTSFQTPAAKEDLDNRKTYLVKNDNMLHSTDNLQASIAGNTSGRESHDSAVESESEESSIPHDFRTRTFVVDTYCCICNQLLIGNCNQVKVPPCLQSTPNCL